MSAQKISFGVVLLALWFWSPVLTQGQMIDSAGGASGYELKLNKITRQLMTTPDYRALDSGMSSRPSLTNVKWLQIEVEFESKPEWADDVQVKYYVLLGKGQDARLFVGDVTHVNVARGNRHYSAMFMHPNTVERYGHGQIEAVAAQIFYKNRPVDQNSVPPMDARWWEKYTPTPGFLLMPQQTPWSLTMYDHYEAVKNTP